MCQHDADSLDKKKEGVLVVTDKHVVAFLSILSRISSGLLIVYIDPLYNKNLVGG